MTDNDPPKLENVLDFPDDQRKDDLRWMVLFPDDYENFGRDPDGNLAVLVDQEQAGEILTLAAEIVASLSHRDAEGSDVLEDLRDALEQEVSADE